MDKNTLLIFAKRILNSSSKVKATVSLQQLEQILVEQGAPSDQLRLLHEIIRSVPELREIAKKPVLTEADVEIAKRRTREREAREEAARMYSRC